MKVADKEPGRYAWAPAAPRLLAILAALAALTGLVSALIVLPSIWLFATGDPAWADLGASPLAVAGLLFTVPLLVAAPLAFAFAVRRGHRLALSLGVIWWSLVIALVLAATLPVVGKVSPASLLVSLAFCVGAVAAIVYFWRLRTSFGLVASIPSASVASSPSATPVSASVETPRDHRPRAHGQRRGQAKKKRG